MFSMDLKDKCTNDKQEKEMEEKHEETKDYAVDSGDGMCGSCGRLRQEGRDSVRYGESGS